MSAYGSPAAAYGAANRALGTPRSIEYQVFSEVTGRLVRAMAPDGGFPDLAAAMHDNTVLWSTLVDDLGRPDNALPDELKRQLLGLAGFVFGQTRRVLARKADAEPLVDINVAIMRGLRGQRGPRAVG